MSPGVSRVPHNPYLKLSSMTRSATPTHVNTSYAKQKTSASSPGEITNTIITSPTKPSSLPSKIVVQVDVPTTLRKRFETLCWLGSYSVHRDSTWEYQQNFKCSTLGRYLLRNQQSLEPKLFCFLALDKSSDVLQRVFGMTMLNGTKMVGILGLDDASDIWKFDSRCTMTKYFYCCSSDDVVNAVRQDELFLKTLSGQCRRTKNIWQYFPVPLLIALIAAWFKPMNALQFVKEHLELLLHFYNADCQIWLNCAAIC